MPFFVIWSIGTILDLELDYLVKLGLFVVVYLVVNGTSMLTFDERLMNFLPLGIYFATKICVYYTWFIYIQLYVSPLTTVTFVLGGTALWYCFWKAWKSDPGMRRFVVVRVGGIFINVFQGSFAPARRSSTELSFSWRKVTGLIPWSSAAPVLCADQYGPSIALFVIDASPSLTITVPGWGTVSVRGTTTTSSSICFSSPS